MYRTKRLALWALLVAAISLGLAASDAFAQTADLGVTKLGPDTSPANSDVPYSITLLNAGPDPAANVALSDPIPPGMTFVAVQQNSGPTFACSSPAPGSNGLISCNVAMLPTGSSANFTVTLHIPIGTPNGVTFTNVASVSTTTFDPNSENDSSTAVTSTPPPPTADLSTVKTAPSAAGPNTDVPFSITLANGGPDAATGVSLTDLLPGDMTFVSLVQNSGPALSCSQPPVGSGGTITCTAATFAANATATFTLTGHIPAGTPSGAFYSNTATASSSTFDPNNENDTGIAGVLVSQADVAVTKVGPASVAAGASLTYTITVSNGGPDIAGNVVLTDALPSLTRFVSLVQNTGPAASCSTPAVGANGILTCSFATPLASGGSAQFTLTINSGAAGSITNTATVATGSFDPNAANNTSSATASVTPVADVGVTKAGPATISPGSNAPYSLTVTNPGPSAAASVTLTDTTPANMTFISLQQTGGPSFSCVTPAAGGSGTISCSLATLPAGSTATFSLVLQLSASAQTGTTVVNTANVTTSTSDPNAGNNTSTATASVTPVVADIGVSKAGPASVSPGLYASYSLTVTNSGPGAAASVTLTDAMPANMTFVSLQQTGGPSFICVTPAVGGSGTISCSLATLPAGSTATFSLVLQLSASAPAGSTIANTANVAASTNDPNAANNTSNATLTVAAATVSVPIPAVSWLGLVLLTLAVSLVAVTRSSPARGAIFNGSVPETSVTLQRRRDSRRCRVDRSRDRRTVGRSP